MGRPRPGRGLDPPRRGASAGVGSPARADRATRRPLARRARRLLPARDPAEPPARLPPRADAARASQPAPGLGPRRPAAGAARHRARDAPLALRPAAPRRERASRPARGGATRARPLEPPDAVGDPLHRRGPPARPDVGRLRGELGPHGGQGRDLGRPRALRRPERANARRPRPVPRRPGGAHRRHRLAAGGRLPRAAATRGVRRRSAQLRPRSGPSARAGDRQHPDQHAVRVPFLRTARRLVVGVGSGRALLAALPPAPAGRRVAGAVRRGARSAGSGRPGAEPHRHRRARDAAAARRRRRLERRHRPARRARQRPARGLRALRRGRAGRRVVGREERDRRALPRRGEPPARSTRHGRSTRSSPASSGAWRDPRELEAAAARRHRDRRRAGRRAERGAGRRRDPRRGSTG